MSRIRAIAFKRTGALLAFFCCITLPVLLSAGEKQYPIEGTVTALGTNQDPSSGDKALVLTHPHRTYTVKTPTRVFVLECPYGLEDLLPPHECGGKKKFAIGDSIHLRVQKRYAYVRTDKGKEQRLAVLSEAIN